MNNKPQKFGKRNFFVETAPELPRDTMARFTVENRRATIQNIQMIEDIAPVFTAENVNSGFDWKNSIHYQ